MPAALPTVCLNNPVQHLIGIEIEFVAKLFEI